MNVNNKRFKKKVTIGLVLALLLTCSWSWTWAQYKQDYHVIRAEGRIPNDFLNLVRGQSRININNSERLNKMQRENFRDATNLALRNIFIDGNVYFNDPLTEYVRIVGDRLLKETDWQTKVRFFVSKSYELNASSWQTGTVIINLGLLSRIENESQLAYVLAHEVAHFQMQHPYKQYAQQIKQNRATQSSELVKNFREHFDYSMQYELEADSIALQLLKDAGYDVDESMTTLEILLHKKARPSVNLIEYLSSADFQLNENNICDFEAYSAFKKNAMQYANQHFSHKHIKKRLNRLQELIELKYKKPIAAMNSHRSGNTEKGANPYVYYDNSLLENARAIARFEVVQQAFLDANYLKSIHEALLMLRNYPQNEFLHAKIAENFYHIGYYSRLGLLDRIFLDSERIDEDEYARLCCLVNNSEQEDLHVLIHGFVQKLYQDYPTNEILLITMAKSVENTKGLEAAKSYYQKYVKLFPFGQHYPEAKRKFK